MKEILQTTTLNLKSPVPVHLLISCSCIAHVENVAQDFVAVEAEAEGAEGQEELYQELEVAEPAEEQALEANFTNSVSQQDKPWIILKYSVTTLSLSLLLLIRIIVHLS